MTQIKISGFADEIASDFREQLETVQKLGMTYICLRAANGKGIAEYTVDQVKNELVPVMDEFGVKVSSLGSPIGKVKLDDAEGRAKQVEQLHEICKIANLLDTKYIRCFSFYMDEEKSFESQRDAVMEGMKEFIAIAEEYDVILIHENEKDIYGDILERNIDLLENLAGPHFGAAFDFANYVQCGVDPEEAWDKTHQYVLYIHCKDAVYHDDDNVVFGTGDGKTREVLKRALVDEGFKGFMTLEPHLVLFDTLQSLEVKAADEVIKEDKAKDGADGYRMQYEAVTEILDELKVTYA